MPERKLRKKRQGLPLLLHQGTTIRKEVKRSNVASWSKQKESVILCTVLKGSPLHFYLCYELELERNYRKKIRESSKENYRKEE